MKNNINQATADETEQATWFNTVASMETGTGVSCTGVAPLTHVTSTDVSAGMTLGVVAEFTHELCIK